jgi:two-component system, response regulator
MELQFLKVLLVEDNPDDLELSLRAFRAAGLERVAVARDGVEALDYLFARKAHSNRAPDAVPQVVFLDIRIPKLDGLDVLREMARFQSTRDIPIVMLTGSDRDYDRVQSYAMGAMTYLNKPLTADRLLDALERLGLGRDSETG